jgi:hypothetical protein
MSVWRTKTFDPWPRKMSPGADARNVVPFAGEIPLGPPSRKGEEDYLEMVEPFPSSPSMIPDHRWPFSLFELSGDHHCLKGKGRNTKP